MCEFLNSYSSIYLVACWASFIRLELNGLVPRVMRAFAMIFFTLSKCGLTSLLGMLSLFLSFLWPQTEPRAVFGPIERGVGLGAKPEREVLGACIPFIV